MAGEAAPCGNAQPRGGIDRVDPRGPGRSRGRASRPSSPARASRKADRSHPARHCHGGDSARRPPARDREPARQRRPRKGGGSGEAGGLAARTRSNRRGTTRQSSASRRSRSPRNSRAARAYSTRIESGGVEHREVLVLERRADNALRPEPGIGRQSPERGRPSAISAICRRPPGLSTR